MLKSPFLFFLFCFSILTGDLISQNIHVFDIYDGSVITNANLIRDELTIATSDSNGVMTGVEVKNKDLISVPGYSDYLISSREAKKKNLEIFLLRKDVQLPEITYVVDFGGNYADELTYQIEVLPKEAIKEISAGNTADLLSFNGSISVQKSQQGGGSPILRGFEANRVLIVVDGIKMNNAIYRSNHLQSVMTIDPNIIERLEVIFGPASTLYGSDALGGVMHFTTLNHDVFSIDTTSFNLDYSISSSTVDNSVNAQVTMSYVAPKYAYTTNFSSKKFGDLSIGKTRWHNHDELGLIGIYPTTSVDGLDTFKLSENPNLLSLGGYSQYDLFHKQQYKIGASKELAINVQHSNSTNINRVDKLYEVLDNLPRYSEWYYGPQVRSLVGVTLSEKSGNGFFDMWKNILSYQKVKESRVNRTYQSQSRNHNEEEVDVYGLTGYYSKLKTKMGSLMMGYDFQYNDVLSKAFVENINTGELNSDFRLSRYPGSGSQFSSGGIFISSAKPIKENWKLNSGIRYNAFLLNASFKDNDFYDFKTNNYQLFNQAITGNVGLLRKGDKCNYGAQISTGFKAPNVDDFGKVFSKKTNIVVPNVNLKPEYTYNLDISANYQSKSWRLKPVAFLTVIDHIIIEDDYTWDGQDSLLYEGEMKKIKANQNIDRGWISGLSFQMEYEFSKQLSLKSSHNLQMGREWVNSFSLSENSLSHIPPYFGKTALSYRKKKIASWLSVDYYATKAFDLLSPKEQGDVLLENTDYPWYTLLNLGIKYELGDKISLQANLDNILDIHYLPFTSDVSGPGRNFKLTINGTF